MARMFLAGCLILIAPALKAQEEPRKQASDASQRLNIDPEAIQRDIDRMQKERPKMERQHLDVLKKGASPEVYQGQRQALERRESIENILSKRLDIDPEAIQRDIDRMQKERPKMERQHLDVLKKGAGPEVYQGQRQDLERRESIENILSKFHKKELTEEAAAKSLRPLLTKELQPDLRDVGNRIASLEKKLAFWKQVRGDPGVLIRQRVDELLGKREPVSRTPVW